MTAPRAALPPPYRLLWASGIVAVVLAAAAFALWVVNGPATLLDLVAALCL